VEMWGCELGDYILFPHLSGAKSRVKGMNEEMRMHVAVIALASAVIRGYHFFSKDGTEIPVHILDEKNQLHRLRVAYLCNIVIVAFDVSLHRYGRISGIPEPESARYYVTEGRKR